MPEPVTLGQYAPMSPTFESILIKTKTGSHGKKRRVNENEQYSRLTKLRLKLTADGVYGA